MWKNCRTGIIRKCYLQISQLWQVIERPLMDVNQTPCVLNRAVTQILIWETANKWYITVTIMKIVCGVNICSVSYEGMEIKPIISELLVLSSGGFLHFRDIQKVVECFCLNGFHWRALGDFTGTKKHRNQ